MSSDSPPQVPGLGQPPDRTSPEYSAEPQPFGSINSDGSVEEATVANVRGRKHLERILGLRRMAQVQADLHRQASLAVISNENVPSEPLSTEAVSGQQGVTKGRVSGSRPSTTTRSGIITKSGDPQSLSTAARTSKERDEVESRPTEQQSAITTNSEGQTIPAPSSERRHRTSPAKEEIEESADQSLEQVESRAPEESMPSQSRPHETETEVRSEEPSAAATPARTRTNGIRGVRWGSNIELKIGLRMVYEEYKGFSSQKKADVWNQVFKDEPTVAQRGRPVPEETMRTQWRESSRDLDTPGVREWKEIVNAIGKTDQRWLSMRQRFQTAIGQLNATNGWSM